MLDNIGMKAWGVIAAFLSVAGFISGAALANGLNQQEHKLMLHRIDMLEDVNRADRMKFERIMEKLNAIHSRQSDTYIDE